jgi:hypothetical protein
MHYSEGTLMLFNMTFMDLINHQSYSCSRPISCGEQSVPNSDILLKYKDNDFSLNIAIFRTTYCFFSFLQPRSLSFGIIIITSTKMLSLST